MSALTKATKREADAYQAMTDAQADVIAHQLAGIDNAETARLRKKSQACRAEWLTAARLLERASMAYWEEPVTERRRDRRRDRVNA